MASAPRRLLSAASLLEAGIVMLARRGDAGARELDSLVRISGLEIVPVTAEQVALARYAYATFGKGRHRAGLDFGDCFSYALARDRGAPLLFKGDDFGHTDVDPVV